MRTRGVVSPHFVTMHLRLLVTVGMAMMAAAQPRCDPLTQYENGGHCCAKCPPGTRMSSPITCQDPQCKDCDNGDYQDTYTTEPKCKRQPYCDPNKNVEAPAHTTKTQRSNCVCTEGFHCSGEACLTCAPHTRCKPGEKEARKGNATHDTVCQRCPDGTFSNETTKGICLKWTKCEHIERRGTETSDSLCYKSNEHRHVIPIVVSLVFAVGIVIVLVVMFIRCKVKRGCTEFSLKKRLGRDEPPPVKLVGANNLGADNGVGITYVQEEVGPQTPEENEAEPILGWTSLEASPEPSLDMPSNPNLTVNGKFVMQENGNTEKLSRQESQT